MRAEILFALLAVSTQPAPVVGPPAPVVDPPAPAPRASRPPCPEQPVVGEEIVVCGERYDENSPYRVPQQFRNQRSDEDSHASWTARVNDEEAVGRFSDQTVGPFGYLQRSRQRDCEWRAARQEARGRRPDCGVRNRPDQPTDWQRR